MSRVLPPPTKMLPGCHRENVKTDFENKELLGEGSFGKVYKVMHKETGQLYAIKVVSKERMRHASFLKQITNEIMLMQGLEHPNIVKLLTYFENEASIYLVLELGGVTCASPSPTSTPPSTKKKSSMRHAPPRYAALTSSSSRPPRPSTTCTRAPRPSSTETSNPKTSSSSQTASSSQTSAGRTQT